VIAINKTLETQRARFAFTAVSFNLRILIYISFKGENYNFYNLHARKVELIVLQQILANSMRLSRIRKLVIMYVSFVVVYKKVFEWFEQNFFYSIVLKKFLLTYSIKVRENNWHSFSPVFEQASF